MQDGRAPTGEATRAPGAMTGLLILVAALALAWGVIALGQAHAGDWIAAIVGAGRAQHDAPLVETLFTLAIFGPMILIALAGGAIERRNALAPGARPLPMLATGLAVGGAGLTAAMLYAGLAGALAPGASAPTSAGLLLLGLGVVGVQTLAEEVYFRGWLQPALVARWGVAPGVVVSALAFAALHAAAGATAPVSLLNMVLGGLMFGLFAVRAGGIAAAFGAHWAWNAAEQLLWGLDPNPGIGGFGALIDKDLTGAAIWGGSSDGLNASIGMTVTLLAILAPLVITGWRRPTPAVRSAAA